MPTTTCIRKGIYKATSPVIRPTPFSRNNTYIDALNLQASPDRYIVLALVDAAFVDLAINLYETSLRPNGIDNFLFVGVGRRVCEIMTSSLSKPLPCYHYVDDVTIAAEDRDKTQFITRRGKFCWKQMPFGLSSAPGTFQRLMDLVMCGLSYESVLVYLDDLIIMATSFQQLLERFEEVLRRLRAAKLKLNHRKCSLFQRKVSF